MHTDITSLPGALGIHKRYATRLLLDRMHKKPAPEASMQAILQPFAPVALRILSLEPVRRAALARDVAILVADCDVYFAWWCYLQGRLAPAGYSHQILEYRFCLMDYPLHLVHRGTLCERAMAHLQYCQEGVFPYTGDRSPGDDRRTFAELRATIPEKDPEEMRDLRLALERWQPEPDKAWKHEEQFWQVCERYRVQRGAFYAEMTRDRTSVTAALCAAARTDPGQAQDMVLWLEEEYLPLTYLAVCEAGGITPYLSKLITEEVFHAP